MNESLIIDTPHGPFWYDLFYALSIFVTGVLFIRDIKARQDPILPWAMVFLTSVIFLVVGTRLGAYTLTEWQSVISHGRFPVAHGRTVLGGIVGGLTGILVARHGLQIRASVLDRFAVLLPLGMAIQRIGCFLAGCCHGTPTDLPWGVSYSPMAKVFHEHLQQGLIPEGAMRSLPVHPNQLYQAILCLVIAVSVHWLRPRFRRPGSLTVLSVALYLVVRFVTEYTRDSSVVLFGIESFGGLKSVQWLTIAGLLFLVPTILLREMAGSPEILPVRRNRIREVVYLTGLVLLVAGLGGWISPEEFFIVQVMTGVLLLFFFLTETRPGIRVAGVPALACYAGLICITLATQTTAQRDVAIDSIGPVGKRIINEIGFKYGNLRQAHYHAAPTMTTVTSEAIDPCTGEPYTVTTQTFVPNGKEYAVRLRSFTALFNQIIAYGQYRRIQWGGEVTGAVYNHAKDAGVPKLGAYNLALRTRMDTRFLGGGLGFHVGSAMHESSEGGFLFTTNHERPTYANLSASIRLFPREYCYFEYRINELLPYADPRYRSSQYVIGSGFGSARGSYLEIGRDSRGAFFLSGKVMVKDRLGIDASLIQYRAGNKQVHVPEIGLTYQFPIRTRRH